MGRAYIWWEEAPLGGIRAHKARQRPEGDTLAPLALAPLAHAAKPLRLYRTSVPGLFLSGASISCHPSQTTFVVRHGTGHSQGGRGHDALT